MEKEAKSLLSTSHSKGEKVSTTAMPEFGISSKVTYIVCLSISTFVLALTFVVSGLANYPDPEIVGFKNRTGDVSDMYFTQITPAGWAFSIWGIIYVWQALWIVYGWTAVCRSSIPATISSVSLILYAFANLGNILWIYVWGNEYPEYSFIVIVIIGLLLYATAGFQAVHIYTNTTTLMHVQKFKVDLILSWFLVLNGIVIYATWVSIATLLNFTIVLEYFADASSADSGTIGLSLLTVEVIAYFILENTVLDRFARPVFMVYPVVIWALSAVISIHWSEDDEERNSIFTLVLLVVAVILFIIRLLLILIFTFVRRINFPSKNVHV